jgi:hypothetical protein
LNPIERVFSNFKSYFKKLRAQNYIKKRVKIINLIYEAADQIKHKSIVNFITAAEERWDKNDFKSAIGARRIQK